ncbi:OmpA family protein [Altererythrobacter aestiaquae]|uniref:OmpA family protein n=2 Tax=Pontixanthobacter aestiaquae TaxID=1509367 RepID=A0A844Z599_9SPHN|nr:OmpA family protein [Pontixanthobacter aestiaquae]
MTYRAPLAIMLALAMAACTSERAEPEPEPSPTATLGEAPDPEQSEGVSIIREDSDVAQEVIKLQPLNARISFDEGGSDLSDTAIAELEAVLETRQFEAGGPIVLSGHTDSKGTDAANMRAARNRAEAVRDWLVERNVPQSRITVIAIGEQNPARPNAKPDGSPDEEGRAFNRRVDVAIAVPAELALPDPEDETPTLVEQVSAED